MNAPTGTVTFLFTEIEGIARLWDECPADIVAMLERHDAIIRGAVEHSAGVVFKEASGAHFAAFPYAPNAVEAALAAQTALLAELWPSDIGRRTRMALNSGSPEFRNGDYFGQPLNLTARLLATGYGAQILLSSTTQQLAVDLLPTDTSLRRLGEHRLRDLDTPETVYQLISPALPDAFGPLRSLSSIQVPNNLPQQLTSFVGRHREVADLKELFEKSRLVTLIGSGGCGKTRLSLHLASDLLEEFADGVWVVELESLAEPAFVPQSVAGVLSVAEVPGQDIATTLEAALADKRLLLMLDNCEHVLTACAQLTDSLLRSCPHIKIMATSREALGIPGEAAHRVPSLAVPDAKVHIVPDKLAQYESARLFLERANSASPLFALTEENASEVAQVCRQVDGIPLAIELAAARVRSLSVGDISSRLATSFQLLTGGSRTALPRQQTLRATIEWSYNLLSDPEKTVLRRLSLFAGGCTPAAAQSACGGTTIDESEVLDLVISLNDKSLVVAQTGREKTRYHLLATVSQYAAERLEEFGETNAVAAKHSEHFRNLADEASGKLIGPEQQLWLDALEADHDNLRKALSLSLQDSKGGERALQLASALSRFWFMRGYLTEGRDRLNAALIHPASADPSARRAQVLNAAGAFAWSQGDYVAARRLYEGSLEIRRLLGDRRGIAGTVNNLGLVAKEQGYFALARSHYEESLAVHRELEDQIGINACLNNLGGLACDHGDFVMAKTLHAESLAICRHLEDNEGIGTSLNNLGLVDFALGDYGVARERYHESLAIREAAGDRRGAATCLANLGAVEHAVGDYIQAQDLCERALAEQRELSDMRGLAITLDTLGAIASEQEDYIAARAYYNEALRLNREHGHRAWEATNLNNLGVVAHQLGELAEARSLQEQSLAIMREVGYKQGFALVFEALAALAASEGNAKRCIRLYAAADSAREALGTPRLPTARAAYEADLRNTKVMLSEPALAEAQSEGRAMSASQVVATELLSDDY